MTPTRFLVLSLALMAFGCAESDDKTTDTDVGDTDAGDTTAPVVTVTGDNPLVLAEGDTFTDPGATAEDDVDGELEVTASGTVGERDGSYTITYTATDAAGNVGTATREVVREFRGQLALATVGADLGLFGIDADGTITERARALISDQLQAHNLNHMAFSVTPHPTMANTVFVTSFNECSNWEVPFSGCWGNARIDRYTYDTNTVTHDGLAFLMQGPARFLMPTYASGTTTVPLLNQSADPLVITTVVADNLNDGGTASSACDGITLQPGATCLITLTDGTAKVAQANFTITTPDTEGYGYLDSDETDGYSVGGPSWDDLDDLPPCAYSDEDDFQVGECAPTAIAFSPDGTRAYVNDDDEDAVVVFSVDASGDFTYLNVSDGVGYQGIAVNAAGTALYNGTSAYEIDGDDVNRITSGTDGNATEVVKNSAGDELLVSTTNNNKLEIWDIETDPLVPTFIAEISPSESRARYQHHNADLSLFVTVDHDAIASITFDGTSLVEADTLDVPVEPTCVDCDYRAVYRSLQLTKDGSLTVASGFVNPQDAFTFGELPYFGFLTAFTLDAAHALTEASTLELDGAARAILFVDTP